MNDAVSLYALPPVLNAGERDLARAKVLSGKVTAEALGVCEDTLANWRRRGVGPRWVRLSDRRIGYRVGDLQTYLDERTVTPSAA